VKRGGFGQDSLRKLGVESLENLPFRSFLRIQPVVVWIGMAAQVFFADA
jgi:hypothetical protein